MEEEDELDSLLDAYAAEAAAQNQRLLAKSSSQGRGRGQPVSMLAARQAGLQEPLGAGNKGFALLKAMGYQEGAGLGSRQRRREADGEGSDGGGGAEDGGGGLAGHDLLAQGGGVLAGAGAAAEAGDAGCAAPLGLSEQLELLLRHLRDLHTYCYFCGCSYDSAEELAEVCPGLTEEEH
ncbi:hypothetical protein TSOC_001554 [Tetrabaena socialis]|uniref:G-patch domain-containing protein n=1 Tax=Tetrabaena socialis TaxID=47790 RepID=A0A2J8AGE4_9CHLO|nr:hypothetical protein TSOC_001554 [Tetrabaena socialis]|eukprot:PNH11590.1 hypothetical protein TSOC_001554 [Tetrabaena socialis]